MPTKNGRRRVDLPSFLELPGFVDSWKVLGLGDDDLVELQKAILLRPKGHPVIPGTGGLRKVRFAPIQSGQGKRGQVRVVFVYFSKQGIVVLVRAYKKTSKADLSMAEKKAIKQLIVALERELNAL